MRYRIQTGVLPRVMALAVAAIILLGGPVAGQEPVAEPLPVPEIAEQIQSPPPEAPVQPPGVTPFGPSLPPTGMPTIGPVTPPPLPPDEPRPPEDFITIRADLVRMIPEGEEDFNVIATGNVTAWYREYVLGSQSAVASTRTGIATFEDGVSFYFDGQVATGERLTLNMRTGEWEVERAATTLTPEFFRDPELPVVAAPMFLSGAGIFGEEARQITAVGGVFTTCNLDHPHYTIEAREVTIFPGEKLVARDITFNALDRRIIRLPRLAIPLRRIRERADIIPRVGQSGEEGYYLKAAYDYMATRDNTGTLRLDLMTKKGIAQALTHVYTLGSAAGQLYLYRLADQNRDLSSLTGRLNHRQQLGTIVAELSGDIRENSYQYAPETTSTSGELRLLRDRPGANTNFALRQSKTSGSAAFGGYETISSALFHRQQFGDRTTLNVGADLSESFSPQLTQDGTQVEARSGQLNSRLEFQQRLDKFDWGLNANWITNLSDEEFFGSQFAGIERLPELTLQTDNFRIGRTLPFGLRTGLGLVLGQYREEPAHVETERAVLTLDAAQTRFNLADNLSLTVGLGFRQYVYGDETAQYALNTNAVLEQRIGDNSSASLTYRFLRPRGFTPFRFDFIGRSNVLSGSLNLRETERFRLSLLTGYDFRLDENPWQDVGIRVFYSPVPSVGIYTSTGYDINRSRLRAVINQFRFRFPNGFRMDIGSRYDTTQDRFATIRAQIDTPIGKLWRVQAAAGWNGFAERFDYRSLMITRDLHCWEASLVITDQSTFFQETDIRLNFRIKAFPIFEQFGVGAFGQALDTSVGDIY